MKTKFIALIACLTFSYQSYSQIVEVYAGKKPTPNPTIIPPDGMESIVVVSRPQQQGVELFGRGLLDYGFEGQLQATTQFLKINIGEPNKFFIPVYLLIGATSGDFGKEQLNKNTIMSLISPSGGLLNLNGNLYFRIFGKDDAVTSLKFNSMIGAKLITGRNLVNNEALIKPVAFADPGLYFQTGAWSPEDGYKKGGIFWLQAKYALFAMDKSGLSEYFGATANSVPQGVRLEMGIFVERRVNIKLSYFKASAGKNIPTLNDGQFRLALDYSVFKQ